jgi:hypothetical protein
MGGQKWHDAPDMRGLFAMLVAALLGGCVVTPPVGPPAVSPPDLRGTWIGTWGGTPLRIVVIDQQISTGDSGVVIGSWQLLGQYYPTVNGTMTTTIGGEAISTNMTGLIAQAGQGYALTLRGRASAGDQELRVNLIEADRLIGVGQSQYSWGPQGSVQAVRQR